jgi:hypothetical protein
MSAMADVAWACGAPWLSTGRSEKQQWYILVVHYWTRSSIHWQSPQQKQRSCNMVFQFTFIFPLTRSITMACAICSVDASSLEIPIQLIPTLALGSVQSANNGWIMHTASGVYRCQCVESHCINAYPQSPEMYLIMIESLVVILEAPFSRGNSNTK